MGSRQGFGELKTEQLGGHSLQEQQRHRQAPSNIAYTAHVQRICSFFPILRYINVLNNNNIQFEDAYYSIPRIMPLTLRSDVCCRRRPWLWTASGTRGLQAPDVQSSAPPRSVRRRSRPRPTRHTRLSLKMTLKARPRLECCLPYPSRLFLSQTMFKHQTCVFLPRDATHNRCLCHRAVSVCLSVTLF